MPSQKSFPPPEPEASDMSQDVSEAILLEELGQLVDNDTNAPYIVDQRTTLFLKFRQLLSFGGHFSSGVAFFVVAILGSTVFLCSDASLDKSSDETLTIVCLFLGASLIAQAIDANKKQH